jgi:hypothetical protein
MDLTEKPEVGFSHSLLEEVKRVKVGQAISDQLTTEYGVPQGEIISPFIFIIYMGRP